MRFVSKNSNLMIVLSPGLPAQPLSGIPSKAGLYIKFKGGVVEIKDEDMIAKMKAHPAFNHDYIAVEDDAVVKDPFASQREESEPEHLMANIQYGHVEGVKTSGKKTKMTPELKKLVTGLAMEQVKLMLPEAVAMALKQLGKNDSKDTTETKTA